MLEERTYGEDEVAEIFRVAATADAPAGRGSATALPPARGFTLAELQSIGSEAGLAPERVARAAAAVELRRGALRRSDLGMPVSVGRTVDLPRAPTDDEWEMIVADLRDTFRARGRLEVRGGVREWRNGNLHAFVEPTPAGYRLRIRTTKGDATGVNRMAGILLATGVVMLVWMYATGQLLQEWFVPLFMSMMGGGALTYNALRLPGWAHEREEQMEEVAVRTRAMLGAPAPQIPAAALPRPE